MFISLSYFLFLKLFMFIREGYIRTSSEEYDLNNQNLFIHLTNNAV